MSKVSSIHAQATTQSQADRSLLLRAIAIAGSATLLALAAPLVWAAVSAGLGLVALVGLGGLGFTLFQTLPLALQKLENRLLAARKAEAQANPVEQLQNDCLRREERLLAFRRALVRIGAQIESMTEMVQARAQRDPGHVLERQMQAIHRMRQFYDCNVQRLNDAQAALEAFQHQVKQKMFEWEFAQAGQIVMHALQPGAMDDLVQDLLTDAALRSVQDRFNTVFAELDVEMRSMQGPSHAFLETAGLEQFDALTLPGAKGRGNL